MYSLVVFSVDYTNTATAVTATAVSVQDAMISLQIAEKPSNEGDLHGI